VFALFGNSNKNALLASVTLLLFLASCFESILERQASVVAFVAFIALALAFGSRDNKKELSF
jgi:hypothetical protein